MKKIYEAPLVESLNICAGEAIADDDPNSFPYNDGELGWGDGNWT